MHSNRFGKLVVAALLVFLSSCGGGGGGGDSPPPPAPSSAPTGVTATTGNAQVALSWNAVSGATSYNVYTSSTSPASTASTRTTVSGTSATIPSTNGIPVFAVVTAANAGGESGISSEVCANPTPASQAGLTLYDPMCGSTLDGSKWLEPLITRGVSNGAMLLTTRASNMELHTTRGLVYPTTATVFTSSGERVTTLQASIMIPAATASRSGGGEIRAVVRIAYQPPATRLDFPAASLDQLTIQVGLQDTGAGLTAIRRVTHCDNASCTTDSTSGITFTDPAGFSNGNAPASYDTTYTVSISLNETTRVFTWTISGGAFVGTLQGTANVSDYLTTNPNWVALGVNPLSTGFQSAQLRTRLRDLTGGSSAAIGAQFDDVLVGKNAAAALWDDFSGGANSGPVELRADKWTAGEHSTTMPGGGFVQRSRITSQSASNTLTHFQSLLFSDHSTINTIQADVTVNACANSVGNGTNRVELVATLYNDGTAGTAPDTNQANSSVGDVQAHLMLDCAQGTSRYQLIRWNTQSTAVELESNAVPRGSAPVVGNIHTLRMSWDPAARQVTFRVDDALPVVVDPTALTPFAGPANSPFRAIGEALTIPGSGSVGATASMEYRVYNVFTAP